MENEIEYSSHESAMELLETLRQEVLVDKRINSIAGLIKNYLHEFDNLEVSLFHVLLPSSTQVLEEILDQNFRLLYSDSSETKQRFEIKHNLERSIILLDAIDSLMDFLLINDSFQLATVQSVPTSVTQLILTVFQHCYKCNELYNGCQLIEEILLVFKKGREINDKLLKFLNDHVRFNFLFEDEKEVLIDVLDNLCNICEVVSEMNLATLVDTWKCYLFLIKKYGYYLKDSVHFEKVFTIISQDVLKKLYKINDNDTVERESSNTLKLCNFLIKIVVKIIEVFWDKCKNSPCNLFTFFTNVYSVKENQSNLLQTYIFGPLEEICFQIMNEMNLSVVDFSEVNSVGLVMIVNSLLLKLNNVPYTFKTMQFLSALMTCFEKENESSLFFHFLSSNGIIYNQLIVSLAANVLSENSEVFRTIEEYIILKIISGSTLESQFAIDLYLLILRHMQPTMGYNLLLNLLKELKVFMYISILHFNEVKSVYMFMRIVYNQLPKELQGQLLERYSPESNYEVWFILGLKKLPASKQFLKDAFFKNIETYFENSSSWGNEHTDALNTIFALDILSDMVTDSNNLFWLKSYFLDLWDFEIQEFTLMNRSLVAFLFSTLKSLIKVMDNIFSSDDIIKILSRLNLSIVMGSCTNTYVSQILVWSLRRRGVFSQQEVTLIRVMAETLQESVVDFPLVLFILKIKEFLEEHVKYIPSNENIHKKMKLDGNSEILLTKMSNNKSFGNKSDLANTKEEVQNNYCKGQEEEKIEDDDVVSEILSRFKSDAIFLKKYTTSKKISPQNCRKLSEIINRLQQLV